MPGVAIGTSLNHGWAGTQSRTADAIIQNRLAGSDIAFGMPVTLSTDNKWMPITGTVTADAVAGVAFREVMQANTFNPQSNPDYLKDAPCDVMVRGNMTVKCQRGTPTAGSAVYIRLVADADDDTLLIGGFEAAADATAANTLQVPNIEWTTGKVDSNGMAEITIKTRAKG